MNKLGTVAVIHHNGDTVIYGNGHTDELIKQLVANEIKYQQTKYAKEQEWNKMIVNKRNELRQEQLEHLKNSTLMPFPKRIVLNIRDGIDFVFACCIVWAEQLGLIEYIGDKKE